MNMFFQINGLSDYFGLVADKTRSTGAKITAAWMMFFYPVFAVCHPDTAKVLLKSSEPKSKYSLGAPYRAGIPWLGKTWLNEQLLLRFRFLFRFDDLYFSVTRWRLADIRRQEVGKKPSSADSRLPFWHPQTLHASVQWSRRIVSCKQ